MNYYFNYFYYTYLGFPVVIRVAIFFILLSLVVLLFNFFKMVHIQDRNKKHNKLTDDLKMRYLAEIENLLQSETNVSQSDLNQRFTCNPKKFKKARKKKISSILMEFKEQGKVKNDFNFRQLISYFQLKEFWEGQLKYGNVPAMQDALRNLDDINLAVPGSIISSLAYNRNPSLRKGARASHMHHSSSDPYRFLNEDFDKTFNNWDKVKIHEMLSRKAPRQIPNLAKWIKNSVNVEMQQFLVYEIQQFKQYESCAYLLELLHTDHLGLRMSIIDALGVLNYSQAEAAFIENYHLQPTLVQHRMIKAIQLFNTGEATEFLIRAFEESEGTDCQMIIAKALYNYGELGKSTFEAMELQSLGFTKLIFAHVKNPLIKFS